MKPTIVATGNLIRSARAGTTNDYTDMSGCSMATPHVSGIAATVLEHYPEFRTLPHLMRAHLLATSLLHDNVTAPVNNTPAPDATRNTLASAAFHHTSRTGRTSTATAGRRTGRGARSRTVNGASATSTCRLARSGWWWR